MGTHSCMEIGTAAFPAVLLFTDGALSFAHRLPGFGWVAIDPGAGREIARCSGVVVNGGTASLAAEAAAAALAVEWALESGYRQLRAHTDCHSPRRHVRVEPRPRLKRGATALWGLARGGEGGDR